MKRILLAISVCLLATFHSFAQEGTKQLMPIKNYPLYVEFNVMTNGNFGNYSASEKERIYIYLKAGETMRFGMKMNSANYGNNVVTSTSYMRFRVKNPSGTIVVTERNIPSSGNGYISTWEQAVAGPNGAILNGTAITGGYNPLTYTATQTGNHWIEFDVDNVFVSGYLYRTRRAALEFFDVTVTDSQGNVVTNPGDPNRSAGRLWSYGWQLCNTSFTENPVNAHFYVFTKEEFVNKVNFKMTPYSFVFLSNSFGISPHSTETNYVKRTQSMEGDQISGKNIQEYRVFLNDPDHEIWPNRLETPPEVKVWAEDDLFMDYDYIRDPLYLSLDTTSVVLEKNMSSCSFDDVTFFKIESSLDGYAVVLLDLDKDGEYSSDGSDKVIYRELKRGLNYILWDFKSDNGSLVPNDTYNASATFLGRAPTHFPMYDVETLDGITTQAVRPFNKLKTTVYWDDTQITAWGDPSGGTLMDGTQQKQLRVEKHVPRHWVYDVAQPNVPHNGEVNTMNTWFNALDLGYSSFNVVVRQSTNKCIDGSKPFVGDVYIEGPLNTTITFDRETLEEKFFHPKDQEMEEIEIVTLPTMGTLYYWGNPVAAGTRITKWNISELTYVPPINFNGVASFKWRARGQASNNWSNNDDFIHIVINTPPTISKISDQRVCTNYGTNDLPFTVGDAETPLNELIITGYSSDPSFIPHSGIIISGSGANRTVQVQPTPNKSGRGIVYLMVDDGFSKQITQFAVEAMPSLEFDGQIIVCDGDNLMLNAVESGATYEWRRPNNTIASTNKNINISNPPLGIWRLTVTKTVEGMTCTSYRDFEVETAPITSFSGKTTVCNGDELELIADEVNATYIWRRNGTQVSTQRVYRVSSASSTDAGNYTLEVTKYGCNSTSSSKTIDVVARPAISMSITGSTVDPSEDGTITLGTSQNGVLYNIYKGASVVANAVGSGSNLPIIIGNEHLSIGANNFIVTADNGGCEVELTNTPNAIINVTTPGITVSPTNLNTTENGSTVIFNVKLDTKPSGDVTIPVHSDNTTQGTLSHSTIVLTASNYSSGINVTVTPGRDYEVNSGVSYTIVVGTSSSSDSYYNGIKPNDISVFNQNIDVASINVTPSTIQTSESGTSDSFTVTLSSKPSQNVTINFSGIVSAEGEFTTAIPLTFTKDNWDQPQTVTVKGIADNTQDGDQTYTINLASSSTDANYQNLTAHVQVTNLDIDVADITINPITSPSNRLRTYEDQSQPKPTVTIGLATRPTNNVTINLTSSNTNEGTVSPSTITFTRSNWEARTVTISGVDDFVDDNDVNYQVDLTVATGSASEYIGKTATIYLVNENNDVAGIDYTPATITTSEPNISQTLQVRLTSQPTQNITLTATSSNTNEGTVWPTPLTFTPSNWNSYQNITITGVDDDIIDGPQPYTITLGTSGDAKYNALSNVVIHATNHDDDEAGLILSKTSLTTSEDGSSDSFTVRLTAQPQSNVTLRITGLDSSEGALSTTTLTFTPSNWNVSQTVTVTGVDDAVVDGTQTYTLTIAYDSGDAAFSAVTAQVTVENIDDDQAGVSISGRNLTITEGQTGTFTIGLSSRPASGTSVTYSFASPNSNEITLSRNSATFTHDSWNAVDVVVTSIDDNVDDDNQSYIIIIGTPSSSTDPTYTNVSAGNVTVNVTDIHTAGLTVSNASGHTTENGGTATFTIRLNTKPIGNVNITLSSNNSNEGLVTQVSRGTASPATNSATIPFNNSNWNEIVTVTVTGQDDYIVDGSQEYRINIAVGGSDAKYNSSLNTHVTFFNDDNDVAGLTINQLTSPFQTTEDGGVARFNIQLDSEPTANVTISLSSSNINEGLITRIGSTNVTGNSQSITFTPSNWNTPIEVHVTGQDDFIDDGDVSYFINVSVSSTDSNYGSAQNTQLALLNIDNDTAGVTTTPITTPFQTTENGGEAKFEVVLNTQPVSSVTITSISENTAEGVIVTGGSLTFTDMNWNIPQEVTVRGVDDDFVDGNQNYTIALSSTSSDTKYDGITIAKVHLVNVDNDYAGLEISKATIITSEPNGTDNFTFKLRSKPYGNVTVILQSSNTAEGLITRIGNNNVTGNHNAIVIEPNSWNNAINVIVTGQDDQIIDGDVNYSIILTTSSTADSDYDNLEVIIPAINEDNDEAIIWVEPSAGLVTTEAGGTAQFDVRLNSRPTHPVSIKLTSNRPSEGVVSAASRGTTNMSENEAFITFAPNEWNSPVTVTVKGVDDSYDDGDQAYYIVTHPAVTDDINYNNLNAQDVSLTNRDDDTWGITVTPIDLTINEDGLPKTFTIVLHSRPTHDVTIPIASNMPSRATVDVSEVVFLTSSETDWNTPKIVTVTPINNEIADGTASLIIITDFIVTDDVNYNGYNPNDVSVTINDDDLADVLIQNLSGNATSENGDVVTFDVALNSQPTQNVVVKITSTNSLQGVVDKGSITFTPANWNISQTVTITGQDDTPPVVGLNDNYFIEFVVESDDLIYNGMLVSSIELSHDDNDSAGVSVSPTGSAANRNITTEAGDTFVFRVRLNTEPSSNVVINVVSSNNHAGSVSANQLIFTPANWNINQSVTITGEDNEDPDGNEDYEITISVDNSLSDVNYHNITHTVYMVNNDDYIPRPANDDATAINDETSVTIDVLANDKGLDYGVKSLTIHSQPATGSVTLNVDHTITYTPAKVLNSVDFVENFEYSVCNNLDNCATATVTVTTIWTNNTPVANDDFVGTSINTPVNVDVLFNDKNLYDGGIVVSIVGSVENGNAIVNPENTITFTPSTNYLGTTTFRYRVTDQQGDYDEANITVNVRPINHIPVANDDVAITLVNTPVDINVLANDAGLEDGFGAIHIYTNPANGNVTVNANRTITYTPSVDYLGVDVFYYLLEDTDGDFDIAKVTVNVYESIDATPIANDDACATEYETPIAIDVLANDTGLDNQPINLSIRSYPMATEGEVTLNGDQTITFTPANGFSGLVLFQYTIVDSKGKSDWANVRVTVLPEGVLNHVPVAADIEVTTRVNTPISIDALAHVTGLEDGFGSIGVHKSPAQGAAIVNSNNTITYTPSYFYEGIETFQYIVRDIHGDYDIGTITVNVVEHMDITPVANDVHISVEYETATDIDVLYNDENLDNTPLVVTVSTAPNVDGSLAIVNPDNTIRFTPVNGYSGLVTFGYTVTDATGKSANATVYVTVEENGVVVTTPIAENFTVTTHINTPIEIAALDHVTNLTEFGGLFIQTPPAMGSAMVNTNNTITYTPANFYEGTITFQYRVQDGRFNTWAIGTITVKVVEFMDITPIANDVYISVEYETPTNIDVLYNDENLNNKPLTVTISTQPDIAGCSVSVNTDNTIHFIPAGGYSGIVTFGYTVTDATGKSASATVYVTVEEEGVTITTPVAADIEVTTRVNTPITITALDHVSNLTKFGGLFIHSEPLMGNAEISGFNSIVYTPSNYFIGTVTFEYRVLDGRFNTWDTGTITVHVVEHIELNPIAHDVHVSVEYETTTNIDVLYNDENLDNTPLVVSISSLPNVDGCLAIVNPDNTISFTPANGFSGLVSFEYTVTDAAGQSASATVYVTVEEEGVTVTTPIAGNISISTKMNTPVVIAAMDYVTNLTQFGGLFIHTHPDIGYAQVNSDNTITYTPSNFIEGIVTFQYRVQDGRFGTWAVGNITVTISEHLDVQPIANDVYVSVEYETPTNIDVLYNDVNLVNTPLVVTISTQPNVDECTVSVNPDNTVQFTPAMGYSGQVTFGYTVTDANGKSATATVFVTVLNEGEEIQTPTAHDFTVETSINTPVVISVLDHVSNLTLFGALHIHSSPVAGDAVVNADKTITFTPANYFVGSITFQYRVHDGRYHTWDVGTITVNVISTTQITPTANDDSRATEFETPITVDVLLNDTGLENTPITVSIKTSPLEGEAIANSDNTVTYIPANGFEGIETFEYTITDANSATDWATVTITVLPEGETNHIPVAGSFNVTTLMNTPVDIDALSHVTGLEDGFGAILVHRTPLLGSAVVNSNRTITYTPSNFYLGAVDFDYVVYDVHGDYGIGTITVNVIERPNAIPIANNDSLATSKNTPVNINVLFNDTGLEDEPITVWVSYAPDVVKGTATVEIDNTITFTPAQDFVGQVLFQYTVEDIDGDSDFATVTVVVKDGENHVPIAHDDEIYTRINTPVKIDVLANDEGLEDGFGALEIFEAPRFGKAEVNEDYTITFTPANYYLGTMTFEYKVSDLDGDYDTALVTVIVTEDENSTPVANADSVIVIRNKTIAIDVLANDEGLEDKPIVVKIDEYPQEGVSSIEVKSDNTINLTPSQDYLGIIEFTYKVIDRDEEFDIAQVTAMVVDTIVAHDDFIEMNRNSTASIDILANDEGVTGLSIPSVSVVQNPQNGTFEIAENHILKYTPNLNFVGVDSIAYTLCNQFEMCSSAMVRINVLSSAAEKLFIPEGFSPDGDNINDNFEIIGIEQFNKVSLKVYNRWGNIVYRNDNYQNDWDGRSNVPLSVGTKLPTGTYYFILVIEDTDEQFSGNLFLKR